MKKAKLKASFDVGQVFEDGYIDEVKSFEEGTIVEVLKETDSHQYVIYSDDIDEATVVYQGLLEFLD